MGSPLERVVGDKEGAEEVAGPGAYTVSRPWEHKRQGMNEHSFFSV